MIRSAGRLDMNMTGRTKAKIAVGVALFAIAAGVYLSPIRHWLTVENLSEAIRQIAAVWYAPLVYMAAFAVSCVFWVPASAFLIPAGIIWGWKLGSLYAIVGSLFGAVMSFFVARFLGADVVRRFGGEKLARYLDHAGFQTLLIMRMIGLFPFPVLNYAAGFAGVRLRDFFFSTALGIIPSMIVVCYSADAIAHGLMSREDAVKNLLTVAFLLTSVVTISLFIKKRAARTLKIETEKVASLES